MKNLIIAFMFVLSSGGLVFGAEEIAGKKNDQQAEPLYRICSINYDVDSGGFQNGGFRVTLKMINTKGEVVYTEKISPTLNTVAHAMPFMNSAACAN